MAVPDSGSRLVFSLCGQLGAQPNPRDGFRANRCGQCWRHGATKPEIWHSDQGSHFTSPKYLERLQREEIKISMDGRGRALDNIFTERLWRTIKYEEVYLHEYASPKDAYHQLAHYIRFYNFQRPHQALDYLTPAQVHGACTPHALVIDLNHQTLTNHTTLY